jgi:hypothetical protein
MINNSINKIEKLDKKAFNSVTKYLTELQTIRIKGKPQQNPDGSTTVEFRRKLFKTETHVFQLSGFIKTTKRQQKLVFFVSLFDQNDHKNPISFSQEQHKKVTNLIKDKITI